MLWKKNWCIFFLPFPCDCLSTAKKIKPWEKKSVPDDIDLLDICFLSPPAFRSSVNSLCRIYIVFFNFVQNLQGFESTYTARSIQIYKNNSKNLKYQLLNCSYYVIKILTFLMFVGKFQWQMIRLWSDCIVLNQSKKYLEMWNIASVKELPVKSKHCNRQRWSTCRQPTKTRNKHFQTEMETGSQNLL